MTQPDLPLADSDLDEIEFSFDERNYPTGIVTENLYIYKRLLAQARIANSLSAALDAERARADKPCSLKGLVACVQTTGNEFKHLRRQ